MASIRLHKKYGVNPTMPVCAWCGEDTGEIVLLGAAYKGEAPRRMTLNDEPCKKCKGLMAQGITFVERVSRTNNERTGRWCVVKREAVERMINDTDLLADMLREGACNITPDVANALGLFDEKEIDNASE